MCGRGRAGRFHVEEKRPAARHRAAGRAACTVCAGGAQAGPGRGGRSRGGSPAGKRDAGAQPLRAAVRAGARQWHRACEEKRGRLPCAGLHRARNLLWCAGRGGQRVFLRRGAVRPYRGRCAARYPRAHERRAACPWRAEPAALFCRERHGYAGGQAHTKPCAVCRRTCRAGHAPCGSPNSSACCRCAASGGRCGKAGDTAVRCRGTGGTGAGAACAAAEETPPAQAGGCGSGGAGGFGGAGRLWHLHLAAGRRAGNGYFLWAIWPGTGRIPPCTVAEHAG